MTWLLDLGFGSAGYAATCIVNTYFSVLRAHNRRYLTEGDTMSCSLRGYVGMILDRHSKTQNWLKLRTSFHLGGEISDSPVSQLVHTYLPTWYFLSIIVPFAWLLMQAEAMIQVVSPGTLV